jgi:CheY-like chemotaxis protein
MVARRTVVLIDDNQLTLDGYAATLGHHPRVDLVAAIGHDDVFAMDRTWSEIDVVVVDAADEDRPGDQYPGVAVVRHIRANQGERRPTIVVVTGHFFDDGLRHRMAQADADFFFLRPEIRSSEKLMDVVLNPHHYLRGVPPVADKDQEQILGVTGRSDLEEFVDYVQRHELETTLDVGAAVRPPTGRRSLMRHRHELTKAAHISPVNLTTGHTPAGRQDDASIRQLRRIWGWAARVKYPGSDE